MTEQTFMRGALFVVLLLVTQPALAHTESGAINSGFLSGFAHPIFGWDHVAMVAVGLWGVFLGAPAKESVSGLGRSQPCNDGVMAVEVSSD